MKKLLYTSAFILSMLLLNEKASAQGVAINTDDSAADASAVLDVKATNKGMLIPRVALTGTGDVTTIAAPATSLIVYNTATAGGVIPGFYYFDGLIWKAFTPTINPAWALLGNAGTTAGTNFIGTTDNIDFVTRTNNTEKMRVTSAGNVGIGTSAPAHKLSVSGGPLAQVDFADGDKFLLLGSLTSAKITHEGGWRFASYSGSTGISGANSGTFTWNNVNGAGTAFTERMRLTGDGNLGIGVVPLSVLDVKMLSGTPSLNLRAGNNAGAFTENQITFGWNGTNDYRNTIKTRHNGGAPNANSIDFYVWNQGVDVPTTIGTRHVMTLDGGNSGSVGIGTTTPTAKLEVAGQVKITGGTPGVGKVLTSDATGLATWGLTSATAWGLTGNATTVTGTNFLGTTDDVALMFKVNNEKAGFISNSAGSTTFFGYQAGNANTTGFSNTAIGHKAAANTTTGYNNTATGFQALFSNSTGYNNAAFGYHALYSNTVGYFNTGAGLEAIFSNTTGINNTALGHKVMYSNTSGFNNTAIGLQALNSNTTGSNNTALGLGSLFNGNNHNQVTALGAGIDISTNRTNVTAVGYGILNADVTADNSVRIGNSAVTKTDIAGTLTYNAQSAANSNTFPANRGTAGQVLTTNGLGSLSWASTTSTAWGLLGNAGTVAGTNFIGTTDNVPFEIKVNNVRAGYISNSVGTNTSFGYSSLPAASTGVANTALGYNVLASNTTGNQNIAIGSSTLSWNTVGIGNVATGSSALFANVNGSFNVANGTQALQNNTGSNNVAVGHQALIGVSGGSNNTAIGYRTNLGGVAANNVTVIGANAYATVSNALVLGSINGTNGATADAFVGIGTTAPTTKLHINSSTANAFRLVDGNQAVGKVLTSDANGNATWAAAAGSGWGLTGNAGTVAGTNFIGTTDAIELRIRTNNTERMRISPTGYIGINNAPVTGKRLYVNDIQQTIDGDGQATIYGYRNRDSQNDGTSYSQAATNSGVKGFNFWGDLYTFGVAGHSYNDYTRTGGVLGAEVNGTYWGSLGYRSSGFLNYGVYGSAAYASGGGYLKGGSESAGIGAGFYGGVMGGWVRGDVLGFTSAGSIYASYNVGNEYTSGHQADVIEVEGKKVAAYANTSTQLKIYADGYAQLNSGSAIVKFENDFIGLSANGKPVVTVSAVGAPVALYIKSVTKDGFEVAAVDGSASNVEFSWTAVAKRKDASQAELPKELQDAKFDEKLKDVMFNENNKERDGKAIWWDGTQLRYDPIQNKVLTEEQKRALEKK